MWKSLSSFSETSYNACYWYKFFQCWVFAPKLFAVSSVHVSFLSMPVSKAELASWHAASMLSWSSATWSGTLLSLFSSALSLYQSRTTPHARLGNTRFCFWNRSLTFHLITPSYPLQRRHHLWFNVHVGARTRTRRTIYRFHATTRNLFFGLMQGAITWWLVMSFYFLLGTETGCALRKVITSRWHRVGDWLYVPLCEHTQNSDLWAVRVSSRRWHNLTWITDSVQSKWLIRNAV